MTLIRNSALALAITLGFTGAALAGTSATPWYQDQNAGPYVAHINAHPVVHNGDQFLPSMLHRDISSFPTAAGRPEKPSYERSLMDLLRN